MKIRGLAFALLALLARASEPAGGSMAAYVAQLQNDALAMLREAPEEEWTPRYWGLYSMVGEPASDNGRYVHEAASVAMALGWMSGAEPSFGVQSLVLVPWARACRRSGLCSDAVTLAVLDYYVTQRPSFALESVMQLGQLWDQHGERDRAFAAWRLGNRQGLALGLPDSQPLLRLMEHLERVRPFRALPQSSVPADPGGVRPVFIIGMPRSGSTLLERMLATRPGVVALGEAKLLDVTVLEAVQRFVDADPGMPEEDMWRPLAADVDGFAALARSRLALLAGPGAAVAVEKTLTHFVHTPLLARLLPDAVFLHCRRDRRDAALSIYSVLFDESLAPGDDKLRWTLSPAGIGAHLDAYERTMQRVADDPLVAGRLVDVRYEELVTAPEATMRRVLARVGLPYDDAVLRFHESRAVVDTASAEQVNRPLHTKSVGRWEGYERYMGLFFGEGDGR